MGRTKQTARMSTGGRNPRQSLAKAVARAAAINRANQIQKPFRLSKKTWKLRYLKDVKIGDDGFVFYLVVWAVRDPATKKYAESWEPADALKGNDALMDLVDAWDASGREGTMWEYLGLDEGGNVVADKPRASSTGLCTFEAVRNACSLLGLFYSSDVFSQFLKDGENMPHDPRKGMKWSMVRAFCSKLNAAGSSIDIATLDINLHKTSHMGIQAIVQMNLVDGVYLVAAETSFRVPHCAVLHVKAGKATVIDENGKRALTRSTWIDKALYVRKFQASV